MSPEDAAISLLLNGRPPAGLLSSHFGDPQCRAIWTAAEGIESPSVEIVKAQAEIKGIPVSMAKMGVLELELPSNKPEELAKMVIDGHSHRRMHSWAERYLQGGATISELKEVVNEVATATHSKPKSWSSLSDAIGLAMDRIRDGVEVGIPNPYPSLRPYLGDFAEGNLIVLSGFTGHGKTAFGVNLALKIAETHKVKIVSLEMTQEELAFRAMGVLSGIPINQIRYNIVPENKRDDLVEAVRFANELKMEFDDTPRSTMDYIEAIARQNPPELLVVDHLHLMSGSTTGGRTADIGDIARRFKLLAMELKIPILLLAQLRKLPSGEKATKEPELDDLRDSAEIQQSANSVMFVHQNGKDPDLIRVMVKKNRSGEQGSIDLLWDPELTRMRDPVGDLRLVPSPSS